MHLDSQKPLVSVIVPIYKTVDYLEKCLTSICGQTLKNIEILCIDDKSPDGSQVIAKCFANKDDRVRLITHENNLGPGGARNTGICAAQADFVTSVDGDDYIDQDLLKTLYDAALSEATKIDLVECGFRRVSSDGTELSQRAPRPNLVLNQNNSINIFRHVKPAFWGKLWRRSIFLDNEIWFPPHVFIGEDLATTPRYLACSRSIKSIPDVKYNYLQRDASLTNAVTDQHILDYIRVYSILKDFLVSRDLVDRYKKDFWNTFNSSMRFHSTNVLRRDSELNRKTEHLRLLLMLKWAFSGYYDLVRPMCPQELMQHLEYTVSRPSLTTGKAQLNHSIFYKFFQRPSSVRQFFRSFVNRNGND